MLLTQVWEALEYLSIEPPAHLLLRPIAQFFGYTFGTSEKKAVTQSPPAQIEAALGAFPKASYEQMPAWIKDSPGFQKLVSELRS